MATKRSRAMRTGSSRKPMTSTLCAPVDYRDKNETTLRRFIDGESVLIIKAHPQHAKVVNEGMWLRVRLVGPDWFALAAT